MQRNQGNGRSKVGERLAQPPAPEVIEHLYGPRMQEELATSFGYLTSVNEAHVSMLCHQEIITEQDGGALLRAIGALAAAGAGQLELDPEREDLYYNYEQAVIARTGHEVGGRMHTGRSRNDLGATMSRMRCRDVLLELIAATCRCRQALLERAGEHLETVMPGYTHLQPAQPVTYGHWLLAIEQAMGRDTERLFGALERTNLCPLGAAALAGTGFDIAREMTSAWLGFSGLAVNTLDAVASRDFFLETLAAGALLGATLSRMAQDLYVWYTNEFGLVDLPDRVAGTSSIMPQKKNPVVLEHIKGRTSHVIGALVTALATVRNANYSNVIDANREGLRPGWTALVELKVSLDLATVAVESAMPRADVMLERCRKNFSTVTELADELVRLWNISFRDAHEVVGAVVREALAAGLDAGGITAKLVEAEAHRLLEGEYTISEQAVKQALDPLQNVQARRHTGGPAPEAVAAAGATADTLLKAHLSSLEAFRVELAAAADSLAEAVSELANKSAGEAPADV